MALPKLSPEARAEALEKALAVRKERAAIMAGLKTGSLSLGDVLDREGPVVGKAYVRRVLEALPGVGSVRAGQLLTEAGISERRRVQGLGPRQKERLLELFAPRS
ncbi:integration host factor, actinobacterial type [Streptomyces goshikiensis]|uniref:integration host factor, actinobacterial type n=1 Tax=Streptomyces goshikiensis TaxID=1942 RepID=UPI0037B0DDAB